MNSRKCPRCGAPKSPALAGNCPNCLINLGTPDWPDEPILPGSSGSLPRLGDYQLLEEIARGGMGVVYRARQISLNRTVAVKVLIAGQFADETFIQRFRREAEAAASLSHPHIVSIHDVGEHEGRPYFSMELIEGRSLSEMVREKPLPARQAAQLLQTIAEAVHFAHERNLLHRDLKPSNVLVDAQGVPHITDFGLAKKVERQRELRVESSADSLSPHRMRGEGQGEGSFPAEQKRRQTLPLTRALSPSEGEREKMEDCDLTLTGQVLGSPNYMPPEQADPQRGPTTAGSDVYSLGAILYHLLTGRPPFMAETVTQTLRLVAEGEPVLPRLLNPGLSRDLETICLKCLEAHPERRYASAQDLADELGRFLHDEPIRARPVSRLGRLLRWCRRKPALASAVSAGTFLLLVVLTGLPIATYRIERARAAAEAARQQEAALRLRAERAERQTQQQLFNALLEQARATVRSGELGHRVRALDALQRAGAISNSVELRREVFAALTLPDLRFERESPHGSKFTLREPDPGFERIALGRGTGPVEVRGVSDQQLLCTLPASTNRPAHDAKWSPDGRFLAVKRDLPPDARYADWEIWEVNGARRVRVWHDVPLAAIAFHPTLPRLIVGIRPGTVVVQSLDEDREIARFPVGGVPFLLRYAPEGERFAAAHMLNKRWALSVHQATSGAPIASHASAAYLRDFQWHPDGRWLAVPDNTGAVHSMDAQTGAMRVLGAHRAEAASVVFSPDGGWLLSGGWERELICWDARAMRRAFTLGLDSFTARFRSDGRACAVMRPSGIQWYRFEHPTGHREFAENLGSRLRHAAFSEDGRWLAASGDKSAAVWDLSSGGPGALAEEAFEAHFLFTSNELFGSRSRVDADNCFRWRITPATNAAMPPDLARLPLCRPEGFTFLGLTSNSVVMTGSKGSQLLATDELEAGKDQWVRTAAGINGVSPDGRWLGIYRPFSSLLYVYRLPGLEQVAKLKQPAGISDFAFSPLGDEVAIGSSRGLEFWSTSTWKRQRALTNFTSRIVHAPDARTLWLTKDLRGAGLFDARTLEPRLLLPAGMIPLALSPDGRQLAVSVDGQRLQVWNLSEMSKQLRDLGLDWAEAPAHASDDRRP